MESYNEEDETSPFVLAIFIELSILIQKITQDLYQFHATV